MNVYEHQIFKGICPYTNKTCKTNIECVDCAVEREEREDMLLNELLEIPRTEREETEP